MPARCTSSTICSLKALAHSSMRSRDALNWSPGAPSDKAYNVGWWDLVSYVENVLGSGLPN